MWRDPGEQGEDTPTSPVTCLHLGSGRAPCPSPPLPRARACITWSHSGRRPKGPGKKEAQDPRPQGEGKVDPGALSSLSAQSPSPPRVRTALGVSQCR